MSRQQDLLMKYVEEYQHDENLGYTLDTDSMVFLNAEGISGFSGKNIAPGSVLLTFVEDVISGKIKNAVLCLENIDRWSRGNPQKAALLFLQLIDAGCNIHEVENDIIHHQKSELDYISKGLIRSNSESLRKQKLSLKNWDKRFDAVIKNNAVLTSRCPSWLKIQDGKYVELPEQTRSIRLVFELYNKGFGQAYIREELNRRGWLYNNKSWGDWNVHRVLNDIRVTGKHRTQSDNRKVFDGIILYPVIISEVDFKSAEQKLKDPVRSQKINKRANNLFTGILKCGICQAAHILIHTDTVQKRYGRCSHSISGNKRCSARGFKYPIVEEALIEHLRHFEIETINASTDTDAVIEGLVDELIHDKNFCAVVQNKIDSVDIPSERDYRILTNLENKIRATEMRIEELKSLDNVDRDFRDVVNHITPELRDVTNITLRNEFNSRLRKIIRSIKIIRVEKNILFGVEYYISDDVQWLNINASTGELHNNVYMEDNKIVINVAGKELVYDKANKEYLIGGVVIGEAEALKYLTVENPKK